MLRLLASAPEDGWAFVERGEDLWVVRPPYTGWSRSVARRDALSAAIQHHGFRPEGRTFQDWASLVGYLKDQIVETRRARGDEEPNPEVIRKLLHSAPRYILIEYLDRIESELLPGREWNAAATVLTELLRTETVKTDAALFERVVDLLDRCREERVHHAEIRLSLVDQSQNLIHFHRARERWGAVALNQYSQRISTRRQLLMVGG